MRPLTTQQRLTLLFTTFFSLFLVILGVLFITVFRLYYLYQIRKDLTREFIDVTADNIGMDSQGVYFKKDKNGDTLRLHLFNDGVSALFFDTNYQTLRSYGVFETKQELPEDRKAVVDAVRNAADRNAVQEASFQWGGTTYTAYITPLKFRSDVVGSMLLAKSHDELARVEESVVTILGGLGGLGLIGSFMLGFIFTRSTLYPLRSIIRSIEATHLNKLQSKVQLSGNPKDEQVILASKFNEMLTRLNQMSARQKEFIANASHELKTPLTRAIISLDAALMEDPDLPAEVKEAKDDLWELNSLLEQLLVLGQVKEGALPKGNSSINKVVATVLKRYDNELKLRNITVTTDMADFSVAVPEEYLAIVLSNILSNAIKYSSPSSNIHIRTSLSERSLQLRDSGVGMTTEELARLFERFYRGKTIRHATRGHGLGLSLVREICDEYKIGLNYESEKGKGTTVNLAFA